MYTVTLLCTDGARKTQIDKDMLLELMENLKENGREMVHTSKGSYEVDGVIVGDIKDRVIIL